jgi:hypothetical protein
MPLAREPDLWFRMRGPHFLAEPTRCIASGDPSQLHPSRSCICGHSSTCTSPSRTRGAIASSRPALPRPATRPPSEPPPPLPQQPTRSPNVRRGREGNARAPSAAVRPATHDLRRGPAVWSSPHDAVSSNRIWWHLRGPRGAAAQCVPSCRKGAGFDTPPTTGLLRAGAGPISVVLGLVGGESVRQTSLV